jgi:hypothetical protein
MCCRVCCFPPARLQPLELPRLCLFGAAIVVDVEVKDLIAFHV